MTLSRRSFLTRLAKAAAAAPFVLRAAPQAIAPAAEPLHEVLEARTATLDTSGIYQLESGALTLVEELEPITTGVKPFSAMALEYMEKVVPLESGLTIDWVPFD